VRVLAFADEAPPLDPVELVARNRPDAVLTLGDLEPDWIAPLGTLDLPRLGVHGNHDGEDELSSLGIRDLHLSRAEHNGWSFAGFEGCVRYRDGPHQYTQEEAAELARRLPAADVLLCHCPPWGVNDEPDDPAHAGFVALREWVERHRPRYLLHGHTTPDPRTRVDRFGRTEVVWVRGALTIYLRSD
jgi:Icc-related predicted phosphoesterase